MRAGANKEGGKETPFPSLPPRAPPRVSLAPKTPFPFPFKRLPLRLRVNPWESFSFWRGANVPPPNSLAASCLSSMTDPSLLYCLFPFVNGRWRVVHAFYTHCLSVVLSNVSLLKRRKFTSHKSNLIFLFCCSALQHFFHPSLHFYAHPLKWLLSFINTT